MSKENEIAYLTKYLQIHSGNTLQPIHLGDVVVSLNLLYNRTLYTNTSIDVFGPEWISELFDIFDYDKLKYVGNHENKCDMNTSFLEMMPRIQTGVLSNNVGSLPMIQGKCFCHIANKKKAVVSYNNFTLPKTTKTSSEKNITLFQFDSRSLHPKNKTKLSLLKYEMALNILKDKESVSMGVGGKETKPYLKHEFLLGNLSEITENLLACKKFVGVDSGISHLAGTLGISASVICLFDTEPFLSEIKQMYNLFYPTIKFYKKSEIFKGNKCKLHL